MKKIISTTLILALLLLMSPWSDNAVGGRPGGGGQGPGGGPGYGGRPGPGGGPGYGGGYGHGYGGGYGHGYGYWRGPYYGGGAWVGPGWGPWWWGPPAFWGIPYPYYSAPSVIVEQSPPVYVQPAPQPNEAYYWYFCENPKGYYPYVRECPMGWMKVAPSPAPPGQ
jgi:hypothetical protein